jgi:NAD-dependent dihydropyrimidine dehydrogenase PreA subunit
MAVTIDFDLCESTGCCAMVCPEDVIEHENGRSQIVDQQKCTSCWICVDNCIAGAIEVD